MALVATIYTMFRNTNWATKTLAISFLGLLAYLPFHALVSTWAISNFGHALLFKSLKELILLGVLLPLSLYVIIREPKIILDIWQRLINKLMIAYAGLNCLLVLLIHNGGRSEIAGLVFNLRFFAMFMLAQVLVAKIDSKKLQEFSLRCIFWAGVAVVAFGALQVLVLPHDFLRHFGYQASIIPPYFTVDNNQNYVRILSTLRGPNVLGAYLVLWLPFLLLVSKRMWPVAVKYRVWAVLIWLASLVTLFGTRSRSAWIGAIVGLTTSVLLVANEKLRKQLIYTLTATIIGFVFAFALTWNSQFVQTTLWHRDPSEVSNVNSDNQRENSLSASLKAISAKPFGSGPGSVNIASTYGSSPITVENYYLQVAQELGVIGLVLFAAIVVLVGMRLWQQRSNDIAAALFASLVGLSVVSLFLPAWGDETVSMLWWGMAGLVVFLPLAKTTKKRAKL